MTQALSLPAPKSPSAGDTGLTWRLAWRNLWRNPRRTWLTAGGIAFASLLVTLSMSLQQGSYDAMVSSATGFYVGQAQINHVLYEEEGKLEQTVAPASELLRSLTQIPGLHVAPRAQVYALASVEQRSFGAAVVGVDFEVEQKLVSFYERVTQGRLPVDENEVLIGEALARNLGAQLGDELVLLGTGKEGGIGALALSVAGLYASGRPELDRSLVFTHLASVQNGFGLGDEVHALVLGFDDIDELAPNLERLRRGLPENVELRTWQQLLPEVVQGIELDRISAVLFYGSILILVTFSVVNTFIMIIFERTREFGMLLALGARPGIIMRQVQAEALMMWLVGTAIGLLLSNVLVGWAAVQGIPLGMMEEMVEQYYMPSRLYPAISLYAMSLAPLVLLVGTQLAAFLVTLRVRRLKPVEALRAE